ncbi:hypothetical protein [Curtobacterium flaccumfaciens]|uniref:hypothetical protein n=1 Tax=Curtobacterium flaccumfaciens TaxID=2035 RepID=UPI003D9A480A
MAISVFAAVRSTPALVRDGLEADVGRPTRHPTQRHSGRTPEALHRARDEEQRWRTTTISGGTTGTAEIDPGGTATVSRVATALRVGTARVMVVGRPVLASSSAARATVVIVRRVETVRSVMVHPAGTALRVAMAIVRSDRATGTTVRRGRATAVTPAGRRVAMVRAVPIVRDAMAIVRSVVGARTVRVVTVTVRSRVVQIVRVVTATAPTAVDRPPARRVMVTVRTVVVRTVPLVMVTVRTVVVRTVPLVMVTVRTVVVRTVPLVMVTVRTVVVRTVPLVMVTVRTVVVRTVPLVVVRPTVRSAGVHRTARLATAVRTAVVSVTAAVTPAPVSVRPRATTGRTATPTAPSRSVRATTTRRSPRRSRRATSTPPPGWS